MPAGTITALRAQANSSQRVNVFIDDEYAIGVSLTTLASEQLFVGKLVDEETWARLEAAERADKALHAAARLIEARPRSIAEVRLRLRQKQFPAESIDYALARLGELGLLDDAAFSRYWVDNRRSFSSRGSLALRDELRRKGVDRSTIEAALAGDDDPDDAHDQEQERARTVARTALRRYAGSADRFSFQRRLGAYLQRRGFTIDTIRPILNELWAELRAAEEPPSEDEP